ncbi:MAG: GIY-YIG nuclease family protein [Flavisolibacter sp.]
MFLNPYVVYILTNKLRTVLYTGVTNSLKDRLIEHYQNRGNPKTFTGKYHAHYLLYYESFENITEAIRREKEIKAWSRKKKMALINTLNPSLEFLDEKLFGQWAPKEIIHRCGSNNQVPPAL